MNCVTQIIPNARLDKVKRAILDLIDSGFTITEIKVGAQLLINADIFDEPRTTHYAMAMHGELDILASQVCGTIVEYGFGNNEVHITLKSQ